ncbi:proton-conducting transporter membrane subunit [Amphibacillus indicireducens]|uniref:Monovalent cation/H+ antiporter subunit D family protein n=1 Tax=Amphibacillus indicireducens TaxID=1076330 RepID=A0ABP7V7X7_9BACI
MNSTHFPVYIMILLLACAILIPFKKKTTGKGFMITMLSVLGVSLSMAIVELIIVYNRSSPHSYTFGSYERGIGIEFLVDEFSALLTVIVLIISILIVLYSFRDLPHEIEPARIPNYYTLLFLGLFAMIGIIFTNDIFNLYVFVEILSIVAIAIISIKNDKATLMASMKYLIMGSIGSVSVLMGFAFIYMVTGHLNVTLIFEQINLVWEQYPLNILLAMGFILTGFGIKVAIFPLHNWLPDAYSSAPSPSSAFLSGLIVKAYVFSVVKIIYRVIGNDVLQNIGVTNYIMIFGVLSMIMGSVFALTQTDLKRRLAYSSVAQIGYIFLGLGLATELGMSSAFFHIVSHAFMKTALFLSAGSIIYLTGKRNVKDLNGIGYDIPITMSVFMIGMLGMIGIPGTSGFMSKWYLGVAVIDAGHIELLIVILLSSFLNALYYFPIVVSAFLREKIESAPISDTKGIPLTMKLSMALLGFGIIIIGLFPNLIMNVIEQAIPTFVGQ